MGQPIEELELLRREMVVLAREKGFTHPDVLAISQQLDRLVIQIQRTHDKSETTEVTPQQTA